MRKFINVLLAVLIIASIGFVSHLREYTIRNDKKQIEDNLAQFINRSSAITNSIDIEEEINLDNKKYVLFTISNGLGDAELSRGFNNKYKIESAGYGGRFFRHEISKTNKGKYLILKGKNIENKIAYIKALVDNNEYKINIPEQEYFMVYCTVPTETKSVYVDMNNIKLFSSSGVDITEEIFKVLFK